MESKYTRINFIVIIVFIISMVYTTLQLFSLQDELIFKVSTLTTDNISSLSLVLNPVYIAVAITLVAGLLAILLNHKTAQDTTGFQQTSSQNNSAGKKTKDNIDHSDSVSEIKLDFSSIQNAIKVNSDKKDKYKAVLAEISKEVEAGQGAIYLLKETKESRMAELYSAYAFHISETQTLSYAFGEGLIGQVAVEGNTLIIDDVPENYINIVSGLGSASPKHLLITPITTGKKVVGVLELASFTPFNSEQEKWVKESLSLLVNTKKKEVSSDSAPKKNKAENKNE